MCWSQWLYGTQSNAALYLLYVGLHLCKTVRYKVTIQADIVFIYGSNISLLCKHWAEWKKKKWAALLENYILLTHFF